MDLKAIYFKLISFQIINYSQIILTYDVFSLGQLLLTTTHYVFDENLSIIFAKNLRPGETKILVSDNNNKLVPVFVNDVTNVSLNFIF
jgi:hypothetical protein